MLGAGACLQLHHLHLHQRQISKGGELPKGSIHLKLVSKSKHNATFSAIGKKDLLLRLSLKLLLPENPNSAGLKIRNLLLYHLRNLKP